MRVPGRAAWCRVAPRRPLESVVLLVFLAVTVVLLSRLAAAVFRLPGPLGFWASHRLVTIPDPARAAERGFQLPLDDTFEFRLGQGSGLEGLNVFKVDAAGKAEYLHEDRSPRGWSRTSFTLRKGHLERLVAESNALRIFRLARVYSDENICDGSQWCLLNKTGGRRKVVYCDNYFPREVVELAEFVHRDFMNAAEGAKTVPLRWHEFSESQDEIWKSFE